MVEDRVTDGTRIAQLLASELSGREAGSHTRLGVTDADPDVEAAPDGPVGYRVTVDDVPVAAVRLYPDAAEVSLEAYATASLDTSAGAERARTAGLPVRSDEAEGEVVVRVESGATVKRALDALLAGLD